MDGGSTPGLQRYIIEGVDSTARLVHDISGKPPATIEWA
ncbi:MAG TPA: hypothetical protein ENK53_08850 [Thiotrichales bacterium]|nr:hypothetical protein [Thiotrichales bacterium]